MTEDNASSLVVVSFDFGTTYSGYAYSFKNKPDEIYSNQAWAAGSEQLMSLKTPTCVLLDPNEEFVAFGFAAEDKYIDLAEDGEHEGWFLFRRFKMSLYQNKAISRKSQIEDITGKKLPALKVFTHAIHYLYGHFWKTLNNKALDVKEEDVQYVLTVPAIWDDKAKQFMRKACNMAGIPSEQLRMALEPEAASVWCQTLTDQMTDDLTTPGAKYIVVDLGGGTADITVNEKASDGTLTELHKASGGPWGGNTVDNNYIAFISTIFGDVMEKFKQNNIVDYLSMLRNFETKKRSINVTNEGRTIFWIPLSLKELLEEEGTQIKDRLNSPNFEGITSTSGDKLRVEMSIVRKWFEPPLKSVTDHVKNLLSKPELQNVQNILLVGGFGECELAHESFRIAFKDKRVIIPSEPGLTVLRGAVRFGHQPDLISARKSRFTYGTAKAPPFDASIHRPDKKIIMYGEERCNDVFNKMVTIGDVLHHGKEFIRDGRALNSDTKRCTIGIFSSESSDPMYVTDPGCSCLGKVRIDYSEINDKKDMEHRCTLKFWDTEIRVKVEILKTGKIYETTIDFK